MSTADMIGALLRTGLSENWLPVSPGPFMTLVFDLGAPLSLKLSHGSVLTDVAHASQARVASTMRYIEVVFCQCVRKKLCHAKHRAAWIYD